MNKSQISKVAFYYRKDNAPAAYWIEKIQSLIKRKLPQVIFTDKNPDVLIILGGDGTILEGAKKYHKSNPLVFGLNLGHVGFLASVREPKDFIPSLEKFLQKRYLVAERMMLLVSVLRNNREIFSSEALNEATIQNPLGMIDLETHVNGMAIKKFRGSGVLVATATGSTAYNLSAHGPIVMPDIKCMILTEVMTHDVPSPSLVLNYNREVRLKIKSFRQRGLIAMDKNKADVILVTDGARPFALQEGDVVAIKNSSHVARFIELENNYFFKSLKEKFSIK